MSIKYLNVIDFLMKYFNFDFLYQNQFNIQFILIFGLIWLDRHFYNIILTINFFYNCRYQQIAVQWLWELHSRKLGGLLGDEMGLGKTVEVIAFLAGLDCSELLCHNGRYCTYFLIRTYFLIVNVEFIFMLNLYNVFCLKEIDFYIVLFLLFMFIVFFMI